MSSTTIGQKSFTNSEADALSCPATKACEAALRQVVPLTKAAKAALAGVKSVEVSVGATLTAPDGTKVEVAKGVYTKFKLV